MGDGAPFWNEGFWANGFWHPVFWGAEAVAPGRVVCLTGSDRSATTLAGRDRSVTTLEADMEC